MKRLLILLIVLSLSGCITGNPWEQFMTNTEHNFKGKNFAEVKKQLALGGRHETTPETGYKLPNGNRQHEINWGTRNSSTCTLILEVESYTNTIVSVGGKGGLYACYWGG